MLRKYIAEYVDTYLYDELDVVKCMAPNSKRSYEFSLALFLEYACRSLRKRPGKILSTDIDYDLVYNFMIDSKKESKWSPATWNNRLSGVSCFIKFLARQDTHFLSLESRVGLISCQKVVRDDPFYLAPEVIEAVFDDNSPKKWIELRDLTMMQMMFATGMRVEEICSLKIKHLLWVSNQKIHIRFKAKGGKKRKMPLIDIRVIKNIEQLLSLNDRGSKFLFPTRKLTKMSTDNARARVYKAFKSKCTKDNKVTPHVLRRSFAMKHLASTGDMLGVSKLLGHQQITTTQKYVRSNLEDQEAELRRVGMADKDYKSFKASPKQDPVLKKILDRTRKNSI